MRWFFLLVGLVTSGVAFAEIHSVDLKPFVGKTQFEDIDAAWLLPKGRQVVNGVPFQIDGVVEIAGTSPRFANAGPTHITHAPVGRSGERLHLLLAASRGGFDDGTPFAKLI